MLLRARTAARRNDAATGVSMCRSTRSSRVIAISRWRRITTEGRGVTQAAAASRAPPSSRRCSRGWASENPRALTSLREARKTRKSISSSSESATAGPSTRDPSVSSSITLSWPVMMMFSTRVVVNQRLQPAQPEQGVEHRPGQRVLLRDRPGRVAGVDPIRDRRLDQIQHDGAAEFLLGCPVEPPSVGGDRLAQLLRRLCPQCRDERPVDPGRRRAVPCDQTVRYVTVTATAVARLPAVGRRDGLREQGQRAGVQRGDARLARHEETPSNTSNRLLATWAWIA